MKVFAYFHIDCFTKLQTDLLWLYQFELHAPAGPGDGPTVGGILQQSDEELPQLEGAAPGGDREMGVLVRGGPAQTEHCNIEQSAPQSNPLWIV